LSPVKLPELVPIVYSGLMTACVPGAPVPLDGVVKPRDDSVHEPDVVANVPAPVELPDATVALCTEYDSG